MVERPKRRTRSGVLGLLADVVEKLLGDHEADAVGRTATTGIVAVVFQVEPVVKGELRPCPDIANGDELDALHFDLCFAIGRAAMIQKAREIPGYISVNILLFV